jgi:hypothetical protein
MKLLPEETKLFFNNWLGILSYTNDKYNLIQDFGHPKNPVGIKKETITILKNKLWDNVKIIDEYIDSVWDMPVENIQILKGWKNKLSGKYIILKHLKKYTIFFDEKRNILYGVIGITNSINDTIDDTMLPLIVDAVLLPFRNQIIYDSILQIYNISFGSNIRNDLREQYSKVKKEKGIVTAII